MELIIEDINGNGTSRIKLTPSRFDPVKENDSGEIILQSSGYYLIGKEIPAGSYSFKLILDDKENTGDIRIPITIYKDISLKKELISYPYETSGKEHIILNENEVLYFENLIEELDYETNKESTHATGFISDSMQIILTKE